MVSLYHTMIKSLEKNNVSNYVANKILNLPVHQDVEKEQLVDMCKIIKKLIKICRCTFLKKIYICKS